MKRDFLDYLEDILDAMEKAELLIAGVTYEQFAQDFRIHFAVVRALEIIGEASKRLPASLRQQHPALPWRGMAGLRDHIAHGYDVVDLEIVWNVVTREIPQIKPRLRQILQDYLAQEQGPETDRSSSTTGQGST